MNRKIMPGIKVLMLLVFVVPMLVMAQQQTTGGGSNPGTTGGTTGGGSNPGAPSSPSFVINFENPLASGIDSISEFISVVLNKIVVPIGGAVAVFFIIYAGFLFVTAQGNESKVTAAKNALFNALIGTILILGAWAIAQVIEATLTDITGENIGL